MNYIIVRSERNPLSHNQEAEPNKANIHVDKIHLLHVVSARANKAETKTEAKPNKSTR